MSAIFLSEDDVRQLVTMSDAVKVVEEAFRHLGEETAQNQTRGRLRTDDVMLHVLAGVDRRENQLGWKIYTTTREQARFLVGLYDGTTGDLTALIEADYLGQLRTGAASGVASRYLAREDATTLGVIGTGLQARTQAWAIAEVRPLSKIAVFGRDPERREAFAKQLEDDLSCPLTACETAEQVVEQSEILVTATTSKTPVFSGEALQPGTHINAIGSNFLKKSEVDLETFRRTETVTCDSREQCRLEAGDFVQPLDEGLLDWNRIYDLGELVTGKTKRASPESITLFKSVGLGLQDVALGSLILERARQQKRGTALPF